MTSPQFKRLKYGLAVVALAAAMPGNAEGLGESRVSMAEHAAEFNSWRDLPVNESLSSGKDFRYSEFQTVNGSKARLIVVDLNSKKFAIKPVLNESTCSSSATATKLGAQAAVNGGFFNLSNGESTSYVVVDGKQVCEPRTNKALIENPKLKPHLEAIFNRSELRFLTGKNNKLVVRIAPHNEKIDGSEKLVHALQAGPRLLPELTDKQEAFVRVDSDGQQTDSIGVYRTAARTCFGVTPDNHAMILCVAGKGQDEFSSGITLVQLAELLKKLGCSEAINFDGGTSTTMVVRENKTPLQAGQKPHFVQVCGREPETRVKSVLAVVTKD